MFRCFWSTPKSTFVCNLYINKALIQEQSVEKGWVLEGGGGGGGVPPPKMELLNLENIYLDVFWSTQKFIFCVKFIYKEGIDPGTKCWMGVGMEESVPLPEWKKIEFRECLYVFWSSPKSIFVCALNMQRRTLSRHKMPRGIWEGAPPPRMEEHFI